MLLDGLFRILKAYFELVSFILVFTVYGLYTEARLVPFRCKRVIVNGMRISRARKLKRGVSRPILDTTKEDTGLSSSDKVGFNHLPLEIQQQIFDYILPPRLIMQPEFRDSRLVSRIGTFPDYYWNRWSRKKHIRDDSDPTSDYFAHALDQGAWYLDQTPEPLDPSARRPDRYLICGFAESMIPDRRREIVSTGYVDLLRVDRRCYASLLGDLYGRHTISFFGSEMLELFMDNASIEGMQRIKYVHLGIPLPRPGSKTYLEAITSATTAIERMASIISGLEELDVEIALLWGLRTVTENDQDLAEWLLHEAFVPLRGLLKKFVLKVSVLQRIVEMRIAGDVLRPVLVPVKVLSAQNYAALKEALTRESKKRAR
ncbi:hypothetical protein BJY00DRAFT_285706 [Aspergillus carlsbadensis]|nr:hypothetical protein BJY00DRAFT_285706 [Aspergillus carlsbadensis]